jgi:serine/threonine protein kinase
MSDRSARVLLGALPAGTIIGSWRLVEARGWGAYGTVYRAERVGQEDAGPVALKLAHRPMEPRAEREVELLSRVHHPSIPRLLDHGVWTLRDGVAFRFIVMDWIEGMPLYAWAAAHPPSSIQVLGVLAQVSGALATLHREDCVHRDVKGDNVLVNAEGRAFLMDFGAGDFKGSRSLTDELLPPGTLEYRSPEALRFQWDNRLVRGARYKPGPADDVYALGVMAYRMVTGEYPPPGFDMAAQVAPQEVQPQELLPPSARATVGPELDRVWPPS